MRERGLAVIMNSTNQDKVFLRFKLKSGVILNYDARTLKPGGIFHLGLSTQSANASINQSSIL